MSKAQRTIKNLKTGKNRSVILALSLRYSCESRNLDPLSSSVATSASPSVIPAFPSVIPAFLPVIPAKAGIQSAKFQTGFTPSEVSKRRLLSGFTLVELTVALGIFATVMAISMGILLNSLKTMRHVANQAGAMDNISLAMEQMVREIRTGYNISLVNLPPNGFTNTVSFTNHEGLSTTYNFCGTRICRNNHYITAENINITGGFIVTNFNNTKTPRITVAARATDTRDNVLGSVQTTVSARLIHYKPL